MIVAAEISKSLGMLKPGELELLRRAVRACGPLPRADDIKIDELIGAMKGDKKSVGGQINWVLLEEIGRARIVDGREVNRRALRKALHDGLQMRVKETT